MILSNFTKVRNNSDFVTSLQPTAYRRFLEWLIPNLEPEFPLLDYKNRGGDFYFQLLHKFLVTLWDLVPEICDLALRSELIDS